MSSKIPSSLPAGWSTSRELPAGEAGVRVFEARGPSGPAALKLFPPEAQSAARAEAAALAAACHPNLARLVGEGTEPVPWLATEWVEGRHLDDAPDRPLDPDTAARALAQLLGALSKLHSRGLAHGDLRGGNVRLGPDGRVVLLDLGLASRLGRTSVSVSGTAAYLAPERLAGEAPSPAADLWSVGALVLECLAGSAVLNARRSGEALSPEAGWRPALTASLEALTAARASDRPGSAGEALEALMGALPSPLPASLAHLVEDVQRRPAPGVGEPAAPPLVGRTAVMERLQRVLTATRAGQGSFVVLEGEAGLGRSRILEEIGAAGADAGTRVLAGSCREGERGGAGPLREALRPLASELADHPASDVAAVLGPDARALSFVCPEMLELPWVRDLPDPDDLSPDLNKFRVFSAVTTLLRNWSRREPLVLAIDDVQWADHATVELLYYLQRNVVHAAATFGEGAPGGALTLVLTRRDDAAEPPLVAKTIAEARRAGAFLEATLQRLLPAQVGELVGGMLPGAAPPTQLVELVAAESGGVPQLAVALVSSLLAEGLLQFTAGEWRFTGGAGASTGKLAAMLRRRTDRLGPEAHDLMLAGAILGREFDEGLAAEIAGQDGATHERALSELMLARLLRRSGRGQAAFAHEQLRRLVLDEVESGERRACHARAVTALEARREAGLAVASPELARHALAAGETESALRHLPAAAAELRLSGSTTEALELLRRQVELFEQLPRQERLRRVAESLDARQAAAEILVAADRWREAADAFLELLGACRAASDSAAEARALVGLGRTENLTGGHDEAREHLERARELARSTNDRRNEAAAMTYLVQTAYMSGDFEQAESLREPVLAAAKEAGDRQLLAEALRQVGLSQHFRGHSELAIPLYREALQLLEAVGDRRATAATLHNLGILHNARGEHAVAMDCYERSLAIFRELGRRHDTASCLTNIGNVFRQQGAATEAERRYIEAQSIYRELEDRRGAADNLSNLGELDVVRGRHVRARERYAQALAVYRDMGSKERIAFAACNLASAQVHLGDLAGASRQVAEALEIDRELGGRRGVAYDRAIVAAIHRLRGEDAEARSELERALDDARSSGDRFHAALLVAELAEQLSEMSEIPAARRRAEEALAEGRDLGAGEVELPALSVLGSTDRGTEAREQRQRALELAGTLENPEVALRAFRRIALARAAEGDTEGARASMDRAVSLVAELARGLAEQAPGFLERRDIARLLDDLMRMERDSGEARVESILDAYHLLASVEARGAAKGLLAGRLAEPDAEGPELRRLRVFRELVAQADLQSVDGLLRSFLSHTLELVDAERGLLFLLEGEELSCRLALARSGSPLAAPEREVPRQVLEWVLRRRRGLITEDAALDDRLDYSASVADLNVRSLLAAPLFDGEELVGLVYVDRRARGKRFEDEAKEDFEATCADLGRLVSSARRAEDRERELTRLRDARGSDAAEGLPGVVGASEPMLRLFATARLAAKSGESVLITGESGTGKELLARALHACSRRSGKSFVALDCGAIPDTLIESVLFGHVRGAFTGADRDRPGVFEEAEGGTLFLDEITNASWDVQARLLRVLQEREVRRVGGTATLAVDVRVIAATNSDPEEEVRAKRFREDLYYRLAVIPLHVPALRERLDDVALLAETVLREVAERDGKSLDGFTEGALRLLRAHDWPGNVRELRNAVARMAAFADDGRVGEDRVPDSVARSKGSRLAVSLEADVAADIIERLTAGREDFWATVREPLRARAITKDQVREVIAEGLTRTRGSYKKTAALFGLPGQDYTRFMDFLRFNDLKLDFRPFRQPRSES